jgi:hypothetical protein
VRPLPSTSCIRSVWPIATADGIIYINMVHISPWEATLDQGRRRSTSTVHTNAKSSQRRLATNHSIGSLAGDRSDWRHLVFFRHFTTGPDNFNNVLALAFGVLIVMRLIVASLWIMINEVVLPRRS